MLPDVHSNTPIYRYIYEYHGNKVGVLDYLVDILVFFVYNGVLYIMKSL